MRTYIQHFGILGMKWGRRKNYVGGSKYVTPDKNTIAKANSILNNPKSSKEDRTKALQSIGIDSKGRRIKNPIATSADHKAKAEILKKPVHEMSNEELRQITTRIQLEKSYKDITKRQVSVGEKYVSNIVLGAVSTVATAYVATVIKQALERRLKG